MSQRLLEQTARHLTYHQTRAAQARRSHRKRTLRHYHALGIRLAETIPCHWPTG